MNSILVIDSDADTWLAARRVLEAAGFAVSIVSSDIEALGVQPALIIANRAAAGFAALRRQYPAMRILALSEEGLPAGIRPQLDGVLTKPFTASQLLTAVRRCLARAAG
jgi:CheY-like chemotaxis protein